MDDSDMNYYGTERSNDSDEARIGITEVRRSLRRIVVGVDGIAGSEAAVDWAVSEAQLRGVPIHVVMTWQESQIYGADGIGTLGMNPLEDTARELSTATSRQVAQLAKNASRGHDVMITSEAVEGHPAEALLLAAEDAAMLVVGSRGHGGLAGVLLGSVGQHVVPHARCPVVVVPDLIHEADRP
ncbi:universal stress protein [Cryobacterium sp. Y11]|uniref:universal stress protein n=1 Tax=Cryobacterium sp. Y11 TaxID=2045016 RepID=UPI001E534BF8|nr:universal stress protein [Cryobacterium sp. Y11]